MIGAGPRPDTPRPEGVRAWPATIDAEGRGREVREEEREVEGQLELVVVAVEIPGAVEIEHEGFAEQELGAGSTVSDPAPAPVHLVDFGTILAVDLLLAEAGVGRTSPGGLSRSSVVVVEGMGDVDPEARHAPVEPETQHLLEGVLYLRVPPVEVGLGWPESCGGSTARWRRRASTPTGRCCPASCWAGPRRRAGRPTRTSRDAGPDDRSGRRRTTDAVSWCGWAPGPTARRARGPGPRRSTGRDRRDVPRSGCTPTVVGNVVAPVLVR